MQKIYHTSIVMCQIEFKKNITISLGNSFWFYQFKQYIYTIGISQILIFLHQFLGNGRFFLIFTQPYSCFVFSQEFPKIFMGTSEMILGFSRSTFMELHNKYVFHNPHRWFFISDGYIIRDSENVNDNRHQKSFFQNAKFLVKHRLDLMIFLKSHNSSLCKYVLVPSPNIYQCRRKFYLLRNKMIRTQ